MAVAASATVKLGGDVLAGPALIGGVAQLTGLHAALGIVVILCVMCAALAGFVLPRSAREEG